MSGFIFFIVASTAPVSEAQPAGWTVAGEADMPAQTARQKGKRKPGSGSPPPVIYTVPPPPVMLPPPSPPPPPPAPPPPPPRGPEDMVYPPKPLGDPGTWATSNDYPSQSLRAEESGTVGFRITVSESGVPVDCTIVRFSGFTTLDEATCALILRRARFYPAHNGYGQPMTGSYSNSVRWTIPLD